MSIGLGRAERCERTSEQDPCPSPPHFLAPLPGRTLFFGYISCFLLRLVSVFVPWLLLRCCSGVSPAFSRGAAQFFCWLRVLLTLGFALCHRHSIHQILILYISYWYGEIECIHRAVLHALGLAGLLAAPALGFNLRTQQQQAGMIYDLRGSEGVCAPAFGLF